MTQFQQLLTDLNACSEVKRWAAEKTWQEVYDTCHRGDWLLWLYAKTNPDDLQGLTLAKGLCANTVRHLMKDKRSVKAVDVAIAFGKGEIERHELGTAAAFAAAAFAANADAAYADAAYAAAAFAADAAYAGAAADAAYAAGAATAYAADAYAATYAAADAYAAAAFAADAYATHAADAYATYAGAAAYATYAAAAAAFAADADAARKKNQNETADIVRSVLPIEKWNVEYRWSVRRYFIKKN